MAFVYSIDEFGNIHTDDVTHITSNRGDRIIWRHAHEIFDDHIHTTSLTSIGGHIYKSEIFRLYDTQFNHPITYAIHQIQTIDDLILNPLIKFFDAIVTSDVVMIAKDIIKRIHNTATAITIRRQL